jgi:hypothetical protein
MFTIGLVVMVARMDKKQQRIDELRGRFNDLSGELNRLRDEWLEARSRRDHDRETALITKEVALFDNVNQVVKEFGELIGQTLPARAGSGAEVESWRTTGRLRLLLRFDSKIVEVCRKAREGIETTSYTRLLDSFIADHERHLTELRALVAGKRTDASEPGEPDPKVLKDAFAALSKNISEKTRLSVCMKWEEHGVEGYLEALRETHSPEVLALFERHRADGARHLESLRAILGKSDKDPNHGK